MVYQAPLTGTLLLASILIRSLLLLLAIKINFFIESPTITGYQDQLFHPASEYGSYYGTRYEALFVAPFTGNYNFRCSADNQCMMYLSTDETEANRQVIIDFRTGYATSFFTFTS